MPFSGKKNRCLLQKLGVHGLAVQLSLEITNPLFERADPPPACAKRIFIALSPCEPSHMSLRQPNSCEGTMPAYRTATGSDESGCVACSTSRSFSLDNQRPRHCTDVVTSTQGARAFRSAATLPSAGEHASLRKDQVLYRKTARAIARRASTKSTRCQRTVHRAAAMMQTTLLESTLSG